MDIWTRRFEKQRQIEVVDEDAHHPHELRRSGVHPEGIPLQELPEWGENALRFIKNKGLEYEFINSHYWDAGLAGQHLANVLDVPHIHTPHSLGYWKKHQMEQDSDKSAEEMEKQYNFSRRIHHEETLYRECDMVIATSPPQVDLLKEHYDVPAKRITMIPGLRRQPVLPRQRRHASEHPRNAGVRGPGDRLDRPVGAQQRVRPAGGRLQRRAERIPEARLRIACGAETSDHGDHDILDEIVEKIRGYGLEDRVELTASLEDDEMADFYRAADVFALSSRYEPFGMTAVEAMACGAPTVMTTHGGLWRAVYFGAQALYADTTDREEFGIALLQALKYPKLRERLHREGANRVRALFTWTGIAQQLISAVESRGTPSFQLTDSFVS